MSYKVWIYRTAAAVAVALSLYISGLCTASLHVILLGIDHSHIFPLTWNYFVTLCKIGFTVGLIFSFSPKLMGILVQSIPDWMYKLSQGYKEEISAFPSSNSLLSDYMEPSIPDLLDATVEAVPVEEIASEVYVHDHVYGKIPQSVAEQWSHAQGEETGAGRRRSLPPVRYST